VPTGTEAWPPPDALVGEEAEPEAEIVKEDTVSPSALQLSSSAIKKKG
jgi:hypothetical protein